MTEPLNNPRDLAVWALRDRAGNVTAHLDRLLARAELPPSQRRLARELALGTLRRRGTLEVVLKAFLKQPDRRLPSPLTEILHVAVYQLLFLDRVPDFAAVSEAVDQADRFQHKRQAGLVNGVLRTIARNVSPVTQGTPRPVRDVLPVAPGAYRTFKRNVLPDAEIDPAGYLAAAYSLPPLLAKRWVERFGSLQKVIQIAAHANVRAPLVLRVNTLRGDLDAAMASLASDGVATAVHANGSSIVIMEPVNVRELSVITDGLVQPQDPTASAVVAECGVHGGMAVLDFCAAPGTKTTHLAQLMGNRGSILAVDVSARKLQRIDDNCSRLGVTIVTTVPGEQVGSLDVESFDLVLADVPCSNTGVLSRRAEARWRFDEHLLAKLKSDARLLAIAAGAFVRPGGRLVYSTCSIEPDECGEIAEGIRRRDPRMKLTYEKLTLPDGAEDPTQWHDGGYVAVFEKFF